MFKETLKCLVKSFRADLRFPHLRVNLRNVKNLAYLKKCMGFSRDPILDPDQPAPTDPLVDLNDRRRHDAEVIATVCANANARTILEIGTAQGQSTALMAENAPQATVHTVNIPPEEIKDGGKLVTHAFSRDEIGSYYRAKGMTNIRQILANTKRWEPDIGTIDVAFVDGCHDANAVFNDTRKVLKHSKSGTIIMWHDICPELIATYNWIAQACLGVERLYAKGLITGPTLHLEDSWIGIYRVP